ncbi:GroES-like protein [Dichomitus squalens LYAD-421 SS1]|uniref:GroES-like protein n=1 Tax=Dichomitus squalens (strain LYAD-421) TaxID=732165 RepID=UPI0004414906|nr:GroES-like protein [Dichomitus squalens LYAD-421 SS1]EJF64045.1 GroES-like protein [Dichomitus squalens LYAD-421 SS1]
MSTFTKQKAFFLLEKHGQFAVRDRDVPTPKPGELLIKNETSSLNPIDWKTQDFGMFVTNYPAVIGAIAVINDWAAYQQYTLSNPQNVAKIPEGISFDEAATLPTALVSSAVALYSQPGAGEYVPPWAEGGKGKYAGQPLVIIGGSSVIGSGAIQWGRLSGFSPIITTASLKNTELLKSYGATHVLDRNLSVDATREETLGYELLAPGGRLFIILLDSIKEKTEGRTVTFAPVAARLQQDPQFNLDLFKAITAYLESGEIKPLKAEVLPGGLAGAFSGVEKLRNNQVSGTKLIVHPQETA